MTAATLVEVHPLARLVPEMTATEYEDLRTDIAANGLLDPITLYEGQILDGRHRYRACGEAGVEPRFEDYDGDQPAGYVLSRNVKRRQLSQSQKAMLATDFLPYLQAEAKERQGSRTDLTSESSDPEVRFGRSALRAAEMVGVGPAQVVRANRVKREDPALAERVRAGEVTVTAAISEMASPGVVKQQAPAPFTPVTERDVMRANAHRRRVIDAASYLRGFTQGLGDIDVARAVSAMEPGEASEWARELNSAIKRLRQLQRELLQRGEA